MDTFQALMVTKNGNETSLAFEKLTKNALPDGEVLIKVAYSGINYKDGLATLADGKIVQTYPFIPGIDASGTVVESSDPAFQPNDPVIVTSYELGVSHFGGYSEYIRVPASWVVPLPNGLTLKEAMIFGTAGFTAALSVDALIQAGVKPTDGKIAVSGATGGVGSIAAAILTKLGYHVTAASGKKDAASFLGKLGIKEIVPRKSFQPEKIRALDKMLYAGAIDAVGGNTLSYLLSATQYGGAVTTCGMAAGGKLDTTVFPFILRGISLLGIDSVYCPYDKRVEIWEKLADAYHVEQMDALVQKINFTDLPTALNKVTQGGITGRYLVQIDATL
ncbi:acrylyl-CoA reductase family protein [Listeria ilorinensis]|uniref:acrylyl-CoA reductase family protein n=1 Tax=Listeria ilorinensis TaxID=2867439 RepID=UPI001EF6EB46|nr:acryloyl-CoA reductase [Listeria ilorinensis]